LVKQEGSLAVFLFWVSLIVPEVLVSVKRRDGYFSRVLRVTSEKILAVNRILGLRFFRVGWKIGQNRQFLPRALLG
jgi:hypothetical protein